MIHTAIARPLEQNPNLERLLEAQLTETFGKRRLIRQLVRRSCPYTSSFQIDELDVHFNDGSRLQLLLKDLGRDGMLKVACDVRPAFLYEPRREINAYRWILPHAPGGTAAQYGAVLEPMAGRYWLFLEYVAGLQLSQVGSFAAWEQSAALARPMSTSIRITRRPSRTRAIPRLTATLVFPTPPFPLATASTRARRAGRSIISRSFSAWSMGITRSRS
jgi:hypothetical protein